jgi:hypothetical protein
MRYYVLVTFLAFSTLGCKAKLDGSALSACYKEVTGAVDEDEGVIIARVDGLPITEAELKKVIENVPASAKAKWTSADGPHGAINNWIRLRTMARLARKAELDQPLNMRLAQRIAKESNLASAYWRHVVARMGPQTQFENPSSSPKDPKGLDMKFLAQNNFVESELAKDKTQIPIEIDEAAVSRLSERLFKQ